MLSTNDRLRPRVRAADLMKTPGVLARFRFDCDELTAGCGTEDTAKKKAAKRRPPSHGAKPG